jgi:hypothetical protein
MAYVAPVADTCPVSVSDVGGETDEEAAEDRDRSPVASRLDSELAELRSLLELRAKELEGLRRRLDARERELAERARDVLESELRVQRAGWRSAHLAEELARRSGELNEREKRLRLAESTIPGDPTASRPGRWDLGTLERLVDAGGPAHPEREDEWTYYLLYLRDHASADGRLPASVDWLVEDVFAEVLGDVDAQTS